MIGFWRKRSKNFVVYFMFFAITIVFVFWGAGRFGSSVGGAAALVNDQAITIQEYRNALQRIIEFYTQMMQGNFDEETQKQYRIRETAINQLINKKLIAENAHAMGLVVTDDEVRSTVTELPMLQKDGRFSRENYDSLLKYYRMSPGQFEAGLREDALIEKSRRLFESSVRPSELELEKEKALLSTKMNAEFLRFDSTLLASKVDLSAKEIQDFLNDQNNKQKIKEYFDLHKSEFTKEAQVKARHILVKATKGDKGAEDAAKLKIAKIQSELKDQDFSSLAKKYSDDPGSKDKGGDLGWFGHGRMVPEFEKVAFEMPEGRISDPIQSAFGFHLIKVESKQAAQTTPLEKAQNEIAKKMLGTQKASTLLSDVEKKLAQDPQSAVSQVMAFNKDLKWEESGAFSLNDDQIPKIGNSGDLIAEINSLKDDGSFLPRIFKIGDSSFVIRKKKVTQDAKADSPKMPDSSKELSRNVYLAWSSKLRESAKIKINPQLFGDSNQGPADDNYPGY